MLFALAVLIGCSSDKDAITNNPPKPPADDCKNVTSNFTSNVLPIIQSRCGGCHGEGSTNGPGPLTNFAQISAAKSAINDAAVVNSRMPKSGGPLSASEKAIIKCWIASGANNN